MAEVGRHRTGELVVRLHLDGTAGRLAALLTGAVVLAMVLANALPHVTPGGVLVQGAEFGAVNGLLAVGLVLTYRASRIINFAYGAMGSLAATVAVELYLVDHLNWIACIVLGVVVGAGIGLAVDGVMRRFFTAPRLVVTVATIGLAQALGGLQLFVPGWMGGPSLIGGFSTPLSKAHVELFPVLFNGNDLVIAVAVPVVLVGLGWFLMRTDAGVAVRSVADNVDRALLLGVPVKRLTTLVWVVAGAVAALTTVVSAPSQGLTLSAAAGPDVLLPALAAAVVARMENLPRAFLAGVGLGVVTAVVQFNVSDQAVADVVFLAVILLALLVQRRQGGRTGDAEETWSATGVLRPIPDQLRRLPEVVAGRLGIGAVVVAAVVVAPLVVGPGTQLELAVAVIFGIVAVSLVVLSGWSGSISLGQFAFAGVGGVVAGDLIEKANVDLFVTLVAAAVSGAVLAVVVGLPALRIRGLFLAVTTLALAVAVNDFFLNPVNFSNEIPQSFLRPVLWDRWALSDGRPFYYLCLAVLGLGIAFVVGLRRARAGRVLLAVRDNEKAAGAMAVPTVRTKLSAFVLAGVLAGVAGALYAVGLRAVGLDTYDSSLSLLVFSMAVIGGLGSIGGSLLGVALIELLSDAFPAYQLEFAGVGMLVLLLVLPGGLGDGLQRVRDLVLRAVARRRGLVVPSLLADRRQTPVAGGTEGTDGAVPHEAGFGPHGLRVPPPDADLGAVAAGRDGVVTVASGLSSNGDGPLGAGAQGAANAGVPSQGAGRSLAEAMAAAGLRRLRPAERGRSARRALALVRGAPPPVAGLGASDGTPAAADQMLLSCRGVEMSYGQVQILFGVDLEVRQGEIVALLGTNGAGKSTLLKGVSGLVKVSRGRVTLDGRSLTNAPPDAVARQGVRLMPGGRGVFPTLSVDENLRLGAWLVRGDRQAVSEARRRVLALFPVLGARRSQAAGNLSGGEQQMLSLAMALMVTPRVLLLDELSLGLAPTVVTQLLRVVRQLHAEGTTIVVVEQSVNVALEIAQRAVFLEKGEVRFSGRTADLLARPDVLRSVFIAGASAAGAAAAGASAAGAAAPNHGAAGTAPASHDGAGAASDLVAAAERTGDAAVAARRRPGPEDPVVLEVRGAGKRFGGISAVDGVDLTVRDGEIVGLIGHNGAGKTTLMDLVSGFLPLDQGRVLLGGVDMGGWPAHVRAAAGMGRTFQEARLFPALTVLETIQVALERHLASRDMVAAGLRLPASLDAELEVAERAQELVETMGLQAYREKLIGELSTGTRRIVELACVLAQDPAVLLLDEPSGGVAQRETEALGPLLRHVQRASGCAMLVIEHDMPLLRGLCDRMVALELGRVIATGAPDEVLEHPQVVDSYLGTDSAAINRSGVRVDAG